MISSRYYTGRYALLAAAILTLGAVLATPTGFFSIDELIYALMADAAAGGRLIVGNGYEVYPFDALRARFLVPGPGGLAPQYPSGYAFLAAPFYLFAGLRGLMLLNALAFLATAAVTFKLGLLLSGERRTAFRAAFVFGLTTYAFEYATGIWPHAVSMCVVALAALAAFRADGDDSPGLYAFLAGLIVGLGVTIRLDVILLTPGLALWWLTRPAPWGRIASFALGTLPGLGLAGWLNDLKFDTWLPLSYGRTAGSTALATYAPLALSGLAFILIFAVLTAPAIGRRISPKAAGGGALLVCIAGMLIPASRTAILDTLHGFYVLTVDLQAYRPAGVESGVQSIGSGYLLFFGALKRALAQSLPYLGLLPIAVAGCRASSIRRTAYGAPLLVCVLWIAPFAFREWHGGLSFNMRYFLPLLPFISILAAAAFGEVYEASGMGRARAFRLARFAVMVAAAVFILVPTVPDLGVPVALYGPLALAGGLAVFSIGFAWARPGFRRLGARGAAVLGVCALAWAGVSAFVHDAAATYKHRASVAEIHAATRTLEDGILVVTATPEYFWWQFQRTDSYVAVPISDDVAGLIEASLADARPVYLHWGDSPPGAELIQWLSTFPTRAVDLEVIRLTAILPPSPQPGAASTPD